MKTFYPKDFGMTANEIVELVDDRRSQTNDSYYKRWSKVKRIAASKLSDKDVQRFVNEWYAPLIDLAGEGDIMYRAQEDALFMFAKRISRR
jgi:cytochrome c553